MTRQHGRPWRGEDVRGWFACEKLDGCRSYRDGERMWSRSGRVIPIPQESTAKLPRMHLDGEFSRHVGYWRMGNHNRFLSSVVPDTGSPAADDSGVEGSCVHLVFSEPAGAHVLA